MTRRLGPVLTGALLLAAPTRAFSQTCDFPDAPAPISGILNTYYPGQDDEDPGNQVFDLGPADPRGATTPIAAGDLLLVVQIQDATLDSSNASDYGDGVAGDPARGWTALRFTGNYEYVIAANGVGLGGGNVTVIGAGPGDFMLNGYNRGSGVPNGANEGPWRYQVIRVPRFRNATLGGTLTAPPWNGETGGVVALDLSGTLNLNGQTIDVSGRGFRGGAARQLTGDGGGSNNDYVSDSGSDFHGQKGEGVSGTPEWVWDGTAVTQLAGAVSFTNSTARGAPGNAGGGGTDWDPANNDENTGGGGGGNGGIGGQGGNSWNSNQPRGGYGGAALAQPNPFDATSRLILGGGGGAGSFNGGPAPLAPGHGGRGGGLVLLRAESLTGTGAINANGANGTTAQPDGGGGGGAGGTVLVATASGVLTGLTVTANGGNGGNAWPNQAPGGFPGNRHGPGGGGGGGTVLLSSAAGATSVGGGAPGTTTTAADTYGATAGQAGAARANVDRNLIPGVQTCLAVTRATIRGLRVEPGAIVFATASQRGTLGFHVYATRRTPRGLERRLLNPRPLLAPAPDGTGPLVYRLEADTDGVVAVHLEEVETTGRRRLMGPFWTSDERLARALDGIEERLPRAAPGGASARVAAARMALRGAAGASPEGRGTRGGAEPAASLGSGSGVTPSGAPAGGRGSGPSAAGVKVEVAGGGEVRLPLEALLTMSGPSPGLFAPQVSSLGEPVPHHIDGTTLVFQARPLRTDYTAHRTYLVTWDGSVPAPTVALTRSGFPLPPEWTRVERDVFYAPFVDAAADPWLWDVLVADEPLGPWPFELPGLQACADLPLRVGVVGGTPHAHKLRASVNGAPLGTIGWLGRAPAQIEGRARVCPTGNVLSLEYTAALAGPDDVALAFLDVVDVGAAEAPSAAPAAVVRVAPFAPRIEGVGGPWRNGSGPDYLILTHARFRAAAERVAQAKAAQGARPLVVDVERAYDAFSTGVVEAEALRALVRFVRERAPLRNVLVFGDDSFDYRDDLGLGLVSFVPSLYAHDGVWGRVPSENRLADVDGDRRPDVAIGRLPAQTEDEAELLADKVERQAEYLAAAAGRHLFAVDDRRDGDVGFRGLAESVASAFPGAAFADVAQGAPEAHAVLVDALRGGVETLHFFGHAGTEEWTDDGLLATGDLAALAGAERAAVVLTWSCLAQWFVSDWGPTINEGLLLTPDGGALAVAGPTGITDPTRQASLLSDVYAQLQRGATLGEALQRAKRAAVERGPELLPVVEGWSLLGDPALRLDFARQRP